MQLGKSSCAYIERNVNANNEIVVSAAIAASRVFFRHQDGVWNMATDALTSRLISSENQLGNGHASLADVARLAGVSAQTVSRVVNRKNNVAEPTLTRVREALDALSFQPNRIARSLVLSRSESIGVINLGIPMNVSLSQSQFGIGQSAESAGIATIFATVLEPETGHASEDAVARAFDRLLGQRVEGIILATPMSQRYSAPQKIAATLPVVEMSRNPAEGISGVGTDGVHGGVLAGKHLLDLGHRRIAFVDGPADEGYAGERLTGIENALHRRGQSLERHLHGDFSSASGYRAGQELMRHVGVTAIFCANDQMALGVMHAYSDAGFYAPRDFSVVGFDDIPDAQHFTPTLTTIHQDFIETGAQAFHELARLVAGERPRNISLEPSLVIRGSTGAPPPSAS